jgi:hypothetical protein
MSRHITVSKPIKRLLLTQVEGFDSLAVLVPDMRWSGNHAAGEVLRQLDSEQWEIKHNPWVVI